MQQLKNAIVGFFISFIGSIPLGYLNVIGFQLYQKLGGQATALYLLGVIVVEAFVIYGTLIFAQPLAANTKLSRFIDVFSILFMFLLAGVFYFTGANETHYATHFTYAPFLLGLVLSSLNFVQIPFWTGWNLYLLNENYINISGLRKYSYLLGTLVGTFCGMAVLIFLLSYCAANVPLLSRYLMQGIMPLVFLSLGSLQMVKYYKKHRFSL